MSSRGVAGKIDYGLVERQLALGRSWGTISRMTGVSEHDLRQHCDATYSPPDVNEAARRTPPMASGRENRPSAYEPPPVDVRAVPPMSNQVKPDVVRPAPCPAPPPAQRRRQVDHPAPPPPPPPPPPTPPPPKVEEPKVQTPAIAAMPTAGAVAAAIVAAARVLGEDPLTLQREGEGRAIGAAAHGRRYRFAAYAALRARYPGVPQGVLGRLVDLPDNPGAGGQLHAAQGSKWWATHGDEAMDAALTALDGLNG